MADIECLCSGTLHPIGSEDCQREIVPDDELPSNHHRLPLGLIHTGGPVWSRRLYFKHPKGIFSRLKRDIS